MTNADHLLGAALMTVATGIFFPPTLFARQRPNIIYIMTDQQQATAMSCAGNSELNTPNMDRIAEHGVRFTNAYCAMPLSGPSRSCMFTGLMPSEIGITFNMMPLPDSLKNITLGSVLRNAGYECVYGGKWHAHRNSLVEGEYGFHVIKGIGDPGLADACVNWLQQRDGDDPFFLVASFVNPHDICEYSRDQNTLNATVTVHESLDDCPNLPSNFAVGPYDATILDTERRVRTPYQADLYNTPDDWRRYIDAYYRLTEAVDAEIGKILDEVDRQSLWDNTIIIFTSDHGEGASSHQWFHKFALYEEVVNIPFIVCLPGGKGAGTVNEAFVNNGLDLMPSLCDWAEAELPTGRKGASIRPILENGEMGPDYVVCETNFSNHSGALGWMVRTKNYKYMLYTMGKNREQLYDMTTDRGETRNLAIQARYMDVLREHRLLLQEFLAEHPNTPAAMRVYPKYFKD